MIRGQYCALEACWCKSRVRLGQYTRMGNPTPTCGAWGTRFENSYDLGSRPVIPMLLATLLLKNLYFSINILHHNMIGGLGRGGLRGGQPPRCLWSSRIRDVSQARGKIVQI